MKALIDSLLVAAVLASTCTSVRADDVEDAINKALSLYKEGKLNEAATSLQDAANFLNEKKGTTLETALPDMIHGWKGGKVDRSSLEALGGGSSVERKYTKDDKSAKVAVTADSPLLNKVTTFLANPALGGLLGIKARKIGDHTAMVQAKEGLLQMAVNSRFLIQIQGKKLSEDELAELAAGVKLDVLTSIK